MKKGPSKHYTYISFLFATGNSNKINLQIGLGTISWKMSNNFINKDSISRQVLSLKSSTTFKHSHIKLRQHYKNAQMFTFNKSWTSNIWKHIGRESTRSCSQCSGTPAHTSPDIQWKLLSVSLDPAEGKRSVGWKGRCGFGEKSACCPRFWKPGIKTTPPPPPPTPVGSKLQSYVACWCACCHDEWTHIKRSNYLEASKHTPVWGDKERFCQRAISHVAFKKHHQECALYRYVFTGKWQKNPLNTNSGILNRGLFVRQFNLWMKRRDIWWHSWLLLLISVGGI